ncbi:MAG TPA: glycosyltransferase family 39 protein, partial [Anaerolineaceae bacterium]|nr:glycosyltransferase family 39 protein [Anaerolineaceae bacterium]
MNNNDDMKLSKYKIILIIILFLVILSTSIFFRFRGLFWGEYLYLHPDERFLVWVGSNIESVKSLGEYFNTHVSSLNPHNRGHGFFVYGDFPIIFTRYITEGFFDFGGWNEVTQAGRILSSLFDLGSVIFIFFIGRKLFNNWVGLLAAAFSGMAVLQIQQSHFFTVDTFATFFTTLAMYVVVLISKQNFPAEDNPIEQRQDDELEIESLKKKNFFPYKRSLLLSILFGSLVGLAAASKINTVTISLLLPIAFFIIWENYPQGTSKKYELVIRDLMLGGFFALLSFRIFQPYAFEGPGFFGIQLNELWLNNMREVSAQSSGNVDFPPALQWARRGFFFSAKNITLWGLGLPLSVFTWLGIITMGWKIIRGEWKKFLLIWIWTVGYFLWQSSLGNSVMRYQLPIYPMFGLMAAWFIHHILTIKPKYDFWKKPLRILGITSLLISVLGTFVWAYMFSSIYDRPITRIDASRWIYENVPGPINLMIDHGDGESKQKIISYPYEYLLIDDNSYSTTFSLIN